MNQLFKNLIYSIIAGLILVNCANRGRPQGGPKDQDPPIIVKSEPENFSTNFSGDVITIYFDEYVKIKNIQKQLIISPPMDTKPDITPLGGASKFIRINIKDTLAPNTTYAFNFGNSIVDNNEENPYPYFRYVFSTGDYIDSLTVSGNILDAELIKPDNFVSVMLYEMDSTYTDSIIFKEQPRYITNTLDSLTQFTIENIKPGQYMLFAMKDANQDNKFQQATDKIAFHPTPITVPNDSALYDLKLFKEQLDPKVIRPRLVSGERIAFGYKGDYENMEILVQSDVPEDYSYRITKNATTDTLDYWYKPRLEVDSLIFKVRNKDYEEDFTVKISEQPRDTLTIKNESKSTLNFNEDFILSASTPFYEIKEDNISIMDKDSLDVPFQTKLDTLLNHLVFNFEKTQSNKYEVNVLPQAFTDFFGDTNDSLKYTISTKKLSDYGNARINLKNAQYPVIVQLTNDKGEVKYEQYSEKEEPIDFTNIDTGNYRIRVIYDTNKNGKYDSGNVLKRQQPERIIYSSDILEANANWENIEDFIITN